MEHAASQPGEQMQQVRAAVQPRTLGRYTLIERLGAGGQGEVWRAHDENRGVDVALKILSPALARHPAAWAALEREHALTERLQHPAILQVMSPERFGDVVALPMELACGGDLRRLRGVSYLQTVPVLIAVAEALVYAHARGVVHRDLKPGNVLFAGHGRVKLADFGVAALLQESDPTGTSTRSAGLSPFSASPEQLRGEPPTPADDIYGLGALAYELLSGHPPHYPNFDLDRAQTERVPALVPKRQIPAGLGELVMRMLAKRAAERPSSMSQVLDELDGALNATLSCAPEGLTAEHEAPSRAPVVARGRAAPAAAPAPALRPSALPSPPKKPAPAAAVVTTVTPPAPAATPRPPPPALPAAPMIAHDPRARVAEPFELRLGDESLRMSARPPGAAAPARPRHPGPGKATRWRYLVWGFLCGAVLIGAGAAAALYLSSREDLGSLQRLMARFSPQPAPKAATPGRSITPAGRALQRSAAPEPEPADPAKVARLNAERADFDKQLAALEARGASMWDGEEFSAAQLKAAESSGAQQAGGLALAQHQLGQAEKLLANIRSKSTQVLAAKLAAGDKALAAGHQQAAQQAFAQAHRIDPGDRRAIEGARRARVLQRVLPLLADARRAQAAGNYSRAAQNFSQALALDPENALAKAGLARANAGLGNDKYAQAVGAGEAALGAGRLEEAKSDFQQALAYRRNGNKATAGLARVNAAMQASRLAALRQEATALERQEHWNQALKLYRAALLQDPSLAFAQHGEARAAARARLANGLERLIDHPNLLASPAARKQAMTLLQAARIQNPSGPKLEAQIAGLSRLLPQFNRPVPLNLVSDDATQVTIPSIGVFGTFARREIRLMPGTYTIIGSRNGYRDVRREFTVMPGDRNMTITVSCSEPI